MKPGDVCVQRGTIHGWTNTGTKTARIYFVLIGMFLLRFPPFFSVQTCGIWNSPSLTVLLCSCEAGRNRRQGVGISRLQPG